MGVGRFQSNESNQQKNSARLTRLTGSKNIKIFRLAGSKNLENSNAVIEHGLSRAVIEYGFDPLPLPISRCH